MKKQILIMMFLSLAFVFAGVSKSFGQTELDYLEGVTLGDIECAGANTLSCIEDAGPLNPLPGEVYTYGITTDPATVATVHWFVTDEANVLAAYALTTERDVEDGDYILTAGDEYDVELNTTKQIAISWKSFDGLTNRVLLVAYVTGADGCADNIEVYRIQPTFGFTLDIAGLLDDGSLGDEECVSEVASATYDGTNLTMNYGENWVFFSVTAANFVDSWQPSFSITNNTGSTVGTVEWAYPAQAILETGTWNSETVAVEAQVTGGAVGPDGECIILRVHIDHLANELATGTTPNIVVGVDGVMYDPSSDGYLNGDLADLDEPTTGTACANDITDTATYTLTPRPDITTNTSIGVGDDSFETKN